MLTVISLESFHNNLTKHTRWKVTGSRAFKTENDILQEGGLV